MERNWIKLRNRALPEYRQGIKNFLDFAFEHTTMGDTIFCPCTKCKNYFAKTKDDVEATILDNGNMFSEYSSVIHVYVLVSILVFFFFIFFLFYPLFSNCYFPFTFGCVYFLYDENLPNLVQFVFSFSFLDKFSLCFHYLF